jgi:hypothetical protein
VKGLLTITIVILLLVLALTTLAAQSSLAFEVASIKPVQLVRGTIRGGGCRGWDTPSFYAVGPYTTGLGRCRILATDLKNLIADAFGAGQEHFSVTGA